MRKMTLRGSRATVSRNKATAGLKAIKVQPKNTAAVIVKLKTDPLPKLLRQILPVRPYTLTRYINIQNIYEKTANQS